MDNSFEPEQSLTQSFLPSSLRKGAIYTFPGPAQAPFG